MPKSDMPYLQAYSDIRIRGIMVRVRCPFRAELYKSYLETAAAQLERLVPAQTSDADGELFAHRDRLLSEFLVDLAEQLDELFLFHIRQSMSDKLPPMVSSGDPRLDFIQSVERYQSHMKSLLANPSATADVVAQVAGLTLSGGKAEQQDKLEIVTGAFVEATGEMLRRLRPRLAKLQAHFLGCDGPVRLEHVSGSAGDRHRFGRGVRVLTFSNAAGRMGRVLYKPTPHLANALVVGDMQRLAEIDRRFAGSKSLWEVAAECVEADGHPQAALPTYLIWPCSDRDEADAGAGAGAADAAAAAAASAPDKAELSVMDEFAFVEFLDCQPDVAASTYEEAVAAFEAAQEEVATMERIETQQRRRVARVLMAEEGEPEGSDCIAQDEEAIRRYGEDVGFLWALCSLVNMGDLHLENIFLRGGRPIIVDPEVLFTWKGFGMNSSGLFDLGTGAFSPNSVGPDVHRLLVSDVGVITCKPTCNYGKNKLFVHGDDGRYRAVMPHQRDFLRGYRRGCRMLRQRHEVFKRWMANPLWREASFRVLPISTDSLAILKAAMHEDGHTRVQLKENLGAHLRPLSAKPPVLPGGFTVPPCRALSAEDEALVDYCWREFHTDSLPCFYGGMARRAVYTGDGHKISEFHVPLHPGAGAAAGGAAGAAAGLIPDDPYFPISPLEYLRARFDYMVGKGRALLLQATTAEFDELTRRLASREDGLVSIREAEAMAPDNDSDSEDSTDSDDPRSSGRGDRSCNIS